MMLKTCITKIVSHIYVNNSNNKAIDTHVRNKQLSDLANINVPSELMWLESDSTLVLPTHTRTGTTYQCPYVLHTTRVELDSIHINIVFTLFTVSS